MIWLAFFVSALWFLEKKLALVGVLLGELAYFARCWIVKIAFFSIISIFILIASVIVFFWQERALE